MKSILFSFILIFASIVLLQAQPFSEVRTESQYTLAETLEDEGSFYNALETYKNIYKEDPSLENAIKIADLNFKLRDYQKAATYYDRALKKDKKNSYPDIHLLLGQAYKYQGLYPEAKEAFLNYIDANPDGELTERAKLEIKGINEYKNLAELPENITITNAGNTINSKNSDFGAAMAPDGSIYFSSMLSNELVSDAYGDGYFSRILSVERKEDGTFDKPSIVQQINKTDAHNGAVTFTADGNYLFFTRMETSGDQVLSSKLFKANKSGDGWGSPKEVAALNDDYSIYHPSIGRVAGREVLFFAAERPSGKGGKDLYYAEHKGDGSFGSITPLSENINTSGDEITPFYTEGNLYFSSNGHPSMGGLDIFRSTWNGSAFLAPVNLGKGYNTVTDDFYYFLPENSNLGFLVSNREGTRSVKSPTCCDDIWVIEKNEIVLGLKLSIYDDKTEKPLKQTQVEMLEMEGIATVDEFAKNTGNTNIANFDVAREKEYKIFISRDGYFPDSMTLKTFDINKSQVFEGDVFLKPIPKPKPEPEPEPEDPEFEIVETNQPIRLNNIYYDYDDDKILPASEPDLQTITDLMNEYPTMVIELSSHTDARGSDSYNKKLAQRRADSARRWILTKGVAPERIQAVGYGEERILNRCSNGVECSDDEHRFNRRTEFKIISGPTSIKIEKKRLKKVD